MIKPQLNSKSVYLFFVITMIYTLLMLSGSVFAAVPESYSGFQKPIAENYSLGYGFLDGPINYGCAGGLVYHPGVDLNVAGTSCDGDRGTNIYAVADGVVRDTGTASGEWGTIVIEHNYKGTTVYSQYGHLDSILVSPGQSVTKNDHIGEMGDNGTDCVHLHFEIRKSSHPNPTSASAFCSVLGGKSNTQVAGFYEDPIWYVQNHPGYSGGGKPDLVVREVNLSKTTLAPSESFRIDTRIKNDGDADVSSSFKIKYLLSNGTGIDSSPSSLAEDSISSLGKGDSKWEDATVNAPTNPGTYNISVRADSSTDIDESHESNNYFDPPVVITVAISNTVPEGSFDAVDCASIRGWARDPDTTNPINVHFYADGPSGSGIFVGQMLADGYRGDLPFSDKNHGFDFQLPTSLKNGLNHSIYAYAIDSAGGLNPLLNGSPKSVKCVNPAVMMIITDLILNGDEGKPAISVTPSSLDMGNVNIGQSSTPQTITLKNAGDATLSIGTLSISSTEFTLQNDLCSGKTLAVSATCTAQVVFTPSQAGLNDEKISLPSNDPDNANAYVALKGNGVVGVATLTTIITGNGTGAVNSNPNGIACTTGNCFATFPFGTPVTLMATFSADSLFSGWSGACTNATGDCTVTMDADKSVTATFNVLPPFRISGTQMSYFPTFLDAYTTAQTGSPTTIHARRVEVTENLNLNRNVPLFLKGGFDGSFTANDGYTTIHGILTIGLGSLTVENVIVK